MFLAGPRELPVGRAGFTVIRDNDVLLQVGKHGIIIEFNDPDYNARRSATYLPEVAAHEGTPTVPLLMVDSFYYEIK